MIKNIELMQHENPDLKKAPFSIKANPAIIGRTKEKELLMKFVKSGDICFLTGQTGTGKSSLLLWLAEYLRDYNVFYIDAANIENGFGIKGFLKNSRKGFDRFKSYPRNAVVLLDESQDCNPELQKALKLHWDHNHIKSLIITQINPSLGNFSISFKDRIGNRIIKLGQLNKLDAIKLIESRCKNKNLFDVKTMEEITRRADYIPRKILEFCELLCIKNNGKNELKLPDVLEILGKAKENQRFSSEQKKQFSKKFIKRKKNVLKRKNKRAYKKTIKKIPENKSFDNIQENKANNIIETSGRRLTLLQKKIILNLEKGYKTPGEIAKNLNLPAGIIENELKILYQY